MMPNSLCRRCKHIAQVVRQRERIEFPELHEMVRTSIPANITIENATMQLIEASAAQGCHLCSLMAIREGLCCDKARQAEYEIRLSKMDNGIQPNNATFRLSLFLKQADFITNDPHDSTCGNRMLKMGYLNLPIDIRFPGLPESYDTRSTSTLVPEILNWCSRSLNHCTLSHPNCELLRTDSPFTPTRLLWIHRARDTGSVMLVCPFTDGIFEPKYAALSYVWGKTPQLKLTRASFYALRSTGIPLVTMQKTHRDAIDICLYLKIDYLWIDALCIMQNDEDDWLRESCVMSDVYQGAHLTIAALDAKDTTQGCFTSRNPLMYEPCDLLPDTWVWPARPDGRIDDGPRGAMRLFAESPLHQRAWTLQERLLSPRILYMGKLLFWECRDGLKCEAAWLNDELRTLHNTRLLPRMPTMYHYERSSWEVITREPLLLAWSSIVTMYTSRNMTIPADRPHGIDGVGRYINRIFGISLTAGFWDNPIQPWQLLWFGPAYVRRRETKLNDRAPSWSWLSVDEAVSWSNSVFKEANMFPQKGTMSLCSKGKVVNLSTMRRNAETIITGELHLIGHTLPIHLGLKTHVMPTPSVEGFSTIMHIPDYRRQLDDSEMITEPTGVGIMSTLRRQAWPHLQGCHVFLVQQVGDVIHGLVTCPASKEEPERFYRVGVIVLRWIGGSGDLCAMLPKGTEREVIVI